MPAKERKRVEMQECGPATNTACARAKHNSMYSSIGRLELRQIQLQRIRSEHTKRIFLTK